MTGRGRALAAGTPPGPTGNAMTFTWHNVGEVRTFVRDVATDSDIAQCDIDDLLIAVSEIVTNAICHAGGTGTITLWEHADGLLVEIRDSGPGFPRNRNRNPANDAVDQAWAGAVAGPGFSQTIRSGQQFCRCHRPYVHATRRYAQMCSQDPSDRALGVPRDRSSCGFDNTPATDIGMDAADLAHLSAKSFLNRAAAPCPACRRA